MDALLDGALWTAIWLAAGIVIGVVASMALLANRVDVRAKALSKAAHEVAKINPRAE